MQDWDFLHLLSSEGRDGQDVSEVFNVNTVDRFSVAAKEVVVAPGHVVVEHGAPQSQVVRQRLRIRELSSEDLCLATSEDKKLEYVQRKYIDFENVLEGLSINDVTQFLTF